MPETDSRLDLWRRAIYLFQRAIGAGWTGPLLKAGYADYVIGPAFFDDSGGRFEPDVVSSNGNSWLVLDLTENPASKAPKFDKYRRLNPRYLHDYGLPVASGEPVVISVRPVESNDGAYSQVVVGERLKVINSSAIAPSVLRESLLQAEGCELLRLPELPFTLVPESKGLEVRKALAPYLMRLFEPARPSVSAMQFVDLGLERLSDHISTQSRTSLVTKVKAELETLLVSPRNKRIWGLERTEAGYRASELPSYTAQTLSKVEADIREWCRVKVMLEHFEPPRPSADSTQAHEDT